VYKDSKAVGPSRIALWLSQIHNARVRSCGMDLIEWSLVWSGLFVKSFPKL